LIERLSFVLFFGLSFVLVFAAPLLVLLFCSYKLPRVRGALGGDLEGLQRVQTGRALERGDWEGIRERSARAVTRGREKEPVRNCSLCGSLAILEFRRQVQKVNSSATRVVLQFTFLYLPPEFTCCTSH
jgi:hypothetical protein